MWIWRMVAGWEAVLVELAADFGQLIFMVVEMDLTAGQQGVIAFMAGSVQEI